ncbi:hypothetical protein H6P81_006804 [Aristolochia fimbriata]|uniref:Uncharacterized protein n=1 Tax=Aristolochia fimbriata TaxID=158543 RepID=A0AAV7EYC4_ARIFI|nr:hypothetical protein H6P81_006804 [Aristolochia fimbriata]
MTSKLAIVIAHCNREQSRVEPLRTKKKITTSVAPTRSEATSGSRWSHKLKRPKTTDGTAIEVRMNHDAEQSTPGENDVITAPSLLKKNRKPESSPEGTIKPSHAAKHNAEPRKLKLSRVAVDDAEPRKLK